MNFNKRTFSVFGLIVAITGGVLSFQNCATPKNNSGFKSSTDGLDGQGSPTTFANSQSYSVGRCSSTILNDCEEGYPVNEPDTDVSVWRCVGTGGGSSVRCTSSFSNAAVPGVCSSAINQCIQGQPVNVVNTEPNKEKWECRGFNGGAVATCNVEVLSNLPPIAGVCGSTAYTCNPGEVVRNVTPPPGSSDRYWTCNGINGGAPAPQVCRLSVVDPNEPLCGSTDASCIDETSVTSTVVEMTDSPNSFLWQCVKPGYPPKPCSIPKPTCLLTVEPRTHYMDSYRYTVTVPSGSLPSTVAVRYAGTRADLDGSNGDSDADGSAAFSFGNRSTNPLVITQNNDQQNLSPGNYSRSLIIFSGPKEICRTLPASFVLTPRCDLSFDKTSITTVETHTARFDFAVPEQPLLPTNPSKIVWYGKNGSVEDERGQTSFSLSLTGGVGTKTMGPFAVGNYERYFVAKDSNNTELCKSLKKNFSVRQVDRVEGDCESETHPLVKDTCASGDAIETGAIGDSPTENIWKCQGAGGGNTVTCSTPKIVNYCGAEANRCLSGSTIVLTSRRFDCETGRYTWDCKRDGTTLISQCAFNGEPNVCEPEPQEPDPGLQERTCGTNTDGTVRVMVINEIGNYVCP